MTEAVRIRVPLVLLLGLAVAPAAGGQAFRTESGTAEFTSSVPLHTFTGRSDRLVGRIDLDEGTVDFYVDLETLETGIGKRDRDMRSTLETDRYPFAEFFGRLVTPFDSTVATPQAVRVAGTFGVHGEQRPVEVDGTLAFGRDGVRVEAAWTLNLEDYDIEPPRLLVMKVDEVQRIRIEALLKPESP